MPRKFEAELVGNYLIVWEPEKGSELYRLGFYGKPLGIAKPKTADFDVPLILDLMEGLYLKEKGIIEVYVGKDKRKVTSEELKSKARVIYEDFDLKYFVYRDLRDNNLIVTPGIKFGCDFAVYKQGPGLEHAPYLVSVKRAEDEISADEIVKAGRLATTVRKRFIIAVPRSEGKIDYLIFRWFKA
ncbi:tRNA-intron lyase [Candidatus Bathyarchaeota archaeon B24-2]|nr:MAG: tRNA-intron lyase [Candidatus Bathyarchaeota archaeon B24-2]